MVRYKARKKRKDSMYTRRKILYNLIGQMDNATPIRIQKTMFIGYILSKGNFPYSFFPNKKGCYSINLHDDYHYLADKGFLEYDCNTNSYKTLPADEKLFKLDINTMQIVKDAARKEHILKDDNELIEYTYKKKPYYAYKSQILNDLMDREDKAFWSEFNNIKQKIDNKEKKIYTMGYEGLNIDTLLARLIKLNVKNLVDVRKNAFSMRMEFSKKSLVNGCGEASINYIHCPEVGIDSGKRQELIPEGKRMELFDWYEKEILPGKTEFVGKMADLFKTGSICFLCYEKDPKDCHRSRLADFCLEKDSKFNSVENIL